MANSIVIPLTKSEIGYKDLRYALRSIEKNVKNFKNIVIVGEEPKFLKNVDFIPFSDDPDKRWKERNILRKVQAACLSPLVTNNFLFMNDDHFILHEIDATKYPYYFGGTWTISWMKNRGTYRATANHTRRWLENRGFPDNNFDIHCPIIYNKEKFMKSFNEIDFETPYGYGIKTLYCASNRIDGEYMRDMKMKMPYTLQEVKDKVEGRHVVSSTDVAIKYGLGEYLQTMFPEKSRFEV